MAYLRFQPNLLPSPCLQSISLGNVAMGRANLRTKRKRDGGVALPSMAEADLPSDEDKKWETLPMAGSVPVPAMPPNPYDALTVRRAGLGRLTPLSPPSRFAALMHRPV